LGSFFYASLVERMRTRPLKSRALPFAALFAVLFLAACESPPRIHLDWGLNAAPAVSARNDETAVTVEDGVMATPQPRPALRRPSAADTAAPAPRNTAAAVNARFIWPTKGPVIAGFGAGAGGQRNDGINIAAPKDAPIWAAAAGTVSYVGDGVKSYGNLVLIRHPGDYFTAYAHADRLVVKPGEKVTAGQIIGYCGASGDVDRPQLHFEIRRGVHPLDPRRFLAAQS
jgi:murein DD-endopeptidase MepM/ murein hydrolase activator NlpD